MIQGIFYARFFPQEGPKIVAQSPPGCIAPLSTDPSSSGSTPPAGPSGHGPDTTAVHAHHDTRGGESGGGRNNSPSRTPLVDFDVLQEYIIPRQDFRNRYMTVNSPDGKYTILGFPVVIADPKYPRNEFIFNFGLIVEADLDQTPYERVVRIFASTFAEMEKQDEFLSLSEGKATAGGGGGGGGGVGGEGEAHGEAHGEVHGNGDGAGGGVRGNVAAARRPIQGLLEIVKEDLNNYGECMIPVDEANTLNMKLFPYHPEPPLVKGWHVPVAKTKFADIIDPTWDLTLVKVISKIDGVSDVRRIAHEASVSLDLAKTALRHLLYYDTILLLDIFFFAACYAPRPGVHDFVRNVDGMVDECAGYVSHGRVRVSNFLLVKLMTSFCPGKTVREWIATHQDQGLDVLALVDVRRLVQFGVIKGCLYRVHKYVVSKQYLAAIATGQSRPLPLGNGNGGDPIQRYTDGAHHFDQIITEQNLTDTQIMDKLKALPMPVRDLTILYR